MLSIETAYKDNPRRPPTPAGIKRGVLFFNQKKRPPQVGARMALALYQAAEHTQGYPAREVYFHPDEAPEEATIAGLTVYTDKFMRPGHIRVTTDIAEAL